ncbi:MAG TPA: hypothetical protein VNM87_09605 [Candidatus Udaeobacter sp.]|nr:hypothetical protein [Candidatus Udaeobacter sp.]
MPPLPDSLSIEQKAQQFQFWYDLFARLGITPMFSDNPPAVIWLPLTAATGPSEVATCRKIGRDLLAYADQQEALLGGPVVTGTLPPAPARTPLAPGSPGDDRLARLEAMVAQIAQASAVKAEPEPYQYTTPTPNERRPDPVAAR